MKNTIKHTLTVILALVLLAPLVFANHTKWESKNPTPTPLTTSHPLTVKSHPGVSAFNHQLREISPRYFTPTTKKTSPFSSRFFQQSSAPAASTSKGEPAQEATPAVSTSYSGKLSSSERFSTNSRFSRAHTTPGEDLRSRRTI